MPTADDLGHAVEIADRVWWVGRHMPGDPFQCHVYLIEHGDQSVLFDPGGRITFHEVRAKIEEVVPFDAIRWFVCHHQDPDITAALPIIDDLVTRDDAAIVTHWRAAALIKHYDLRLPFWLVDAHDWVLDLGRRVLEFHFTPYLHFPGAFTTFDRATGTLFSSDLFGGFTDDWKLVATDESYFASMAPFHEHYMPSREILDHGLAPLAKLPITLIAPQHGELIPEPLVATMIARLRNLECGLYLMVQRDTDIRRLSAMNKLLRDTLQHIIVSRDFNDVATMLIDAARDAFPAVALEFYARDTEHELLWFAPPNRYHGAPAEIPAVWAPLLDVQRPDDDQGVFRSVEGSEPAIGMALYSPGLDRSTGVAVLRLEHPIPLREATRAALERLGEPLEVALEREVLQRALEEQRRQFHHLAMHDSLTGLANRRAMEDFARQLFALHDRGELAGLALTSFDVDHFKDVNDHFGHPEGDHVLRRVAAPFGSRSGSATSRPAPAARSSRCITCSVPPSAPTSSPTASGRPSPPSRSTSSPTGSPSTCPRASLVGGAAKRTTRSSPAPTPPCTRRRPAGATARSWPTVRTSDAQRHPRRTALSPLDAMMEP